MCLGGFFVGIFYHYEPGLAGSFDALLVGWLVVVARGLYPARHLFTLYHLTYFGAIMFTVIREQCQQCKQFKQSIARCCLHI